MGASAFAGALAFGASSVSADTYTVESGDTLNKIAQQHETTVEEIATQNNISNVNLIYVGEVFNINVALPSTEEKVTEPVVEQLTTQVASPATQETTAVESSTNDGSDAKSWIANKESGGSYTAVNGQYYGKYQLSLDKLNGDLSSENQERVANNYAISRYGSWENAQQAWQSQGWW